MEKSLTRQTFGVPSQSVLEHKFARAVKAENAYQTSFASSNSNSSPKAAALREAEIHEVALSRYGVRSAECATLRRNVARVTAVSTCA